MRITKIMIYLFFLMAEFMQVAEAQIFPLKKGQNQNQKPKDAKFLKFNDSTSVWIINFDKWLIQSGDSFSLWSKTSNIQKLELNRRTSIYTISKSLKLWKNPRIVEVWKTERKHEKKIREIEYNQINDTIKQWTVGDTIKITEINKVVDVWNTNKNIKQWTKNQALFSSKISDTLAFYFETDTSILWISDNYANIWVLKQKPDKIKLGNNTFLWAIDNTTEMWQINSLKSIWNYKPKNYKWSKNDSIIPTLYQNNKKLWQLSVNKHVWEIDDSIGVWTKSLKKVNRLNDSTFFWQVPPKPILKKKITEIIDSSVLIKPEKYQISFKLNKNITLWKLDDSTQLVFNNYIPEMWTLNNNTNLWKISDTVSVWTINQKTKISILADSARVWNLNDSSLIWVPGKSIKPEKINDSISIWNINRFLVAEKTSDSTQIWNIFPNVSVIRQPDIKNSIKMTDSRYNYVINDTLSLILDKKQILKYKPHASKQFLSIDENTSFIRMDENTRISVINDSVFFYSQKPGNIKYEKLNDSTGFIHYNKEIIIWKIKGKLKVWQLDSQAKTWNVNDTVFIFTFTEMPIQNKGKKTSFWKFGGNGNITFSQGYYNKYWTKGGENNVSALSVAGLFANWAKKDYKFSNTAEFRLGVNSSKTQKFNKNEDKIDLETKFSYKAYKKFFYATSLGLETQFFEGKKDTVRVSHFYAPAKYEFGIGIDFNPKDNISVFFSPITSNYLIVSKKRDVDPARHGLEKDTYHKLEAGVRLDSNIKLDITKDIQVDNKLKLFSNYDFKIKNTSIEWQMVIALKVSRYIATNLSTHLIYNQKVVDDVQFKEILSVGFSYKI